MEKYVTEKWLKRNHACQDSVDHVVKNGYIGLTPINGIKKLIKEDRLQDANWYIVRVMNKRQRVQYAIFAAEQVLSIYEKKYPEGTAPRRAIEATKTYLNNPCKKTKTAAAAAAATADSAATDAYAAADADDAAADAAVYAAAYAAAAAYADAYAAAAAAYAFARKEPQMKILNNGIAILEEK